MILFIPQFFALLHIVQYVRFFISRHCNNDFTFTRNRVTHIATLPGNQTSLIVSNHLIHETSHQLVGIGTSFIYFQSGMTTAQPFQGNFQSNVSRICFHFFIFQHCCQVFTACTTDIQFSFFFRIQIQQNITVYRSRLQAERTKHTCFLVGSNQCLQRTMFQRFIFHDSHDSGNTHTIISSQSRAFSFHPISVNVSFDRIIFKIMHCIVILLRNHVHVCLKNHLLAVFHPRSGRLAINDITGFILE